MPAKFDFNLLFVLVLKTNQSQFNFTWGKMKKNTHGKHSAISLSLLRKMIIIITIQSFLSFVNANHGYP